MQETCRKWGMSYAGIQYTSFADSGAHQHPGAEPGKPGGSRIMQQYKRERCGPGPAWTRRDLKSPNSEAFHSVLFLMGCNLYSPVVSFVHLRYSQIELTNGPRNVPWDFSAYWTTCVSKVLNNHQVWNNIGLESGWLGFKYQMCPLF